MSSQSDIQPDFQEERAALAAVLGSAIFQRAPNLARMLSYVCTRHFEGEQDHVKEYTIAVEALGRPADFNHERDSIVRVEAHRLRKRLSDFYAGEGASEPIRILLPVGQYLPLFTRVADEKLDTAGEPAIEPPARPESRTPEEAATSVRPHPRPRITPSVLVSGLVLTLLILIGGFVFFLTMRPSGQVGRSTFAAVIPQTPDGEDLRLLAGWTKGPYTDPAGRIWQPDRYATTGYAMNYSGHLVDGAWDAKIYETSREGDFQYDIPLAPGTYELRLHFAEMLFGGRNVGAGGEGSRVFNVDANEKRLLTRFDILSDAAGANIADERVFKDISPDRDGFLHLRFTHMIRDPLLNALEILPGIPGKMRPVRIVNSEHGFVDQSGNRWEPDRYYRGGLLIPRPHPVSGTPNPGLFRNARCGNITYVIPVAPESRYTLNLHFAEGWIGTGNPVGGGVGSRRFNIICNEQVLARNFDIFREAGGAERAIERRFRGLQPDPQGKLVIHFQPVESYACINAIEIIDEGR